MGADALGRQRAGGDELVDAAMLVNDERSLADVISKLATEPRYGIDTEFHRERTYYAKLALLQVSWSDGIAIIDPLALDIRPFGEVLRGDGLAVLHAADQDLEVLDRACGCTPSKLFDTQIAAGFLGFGCPSLQSLVDRLLGRQLEKGDQLADWTRRPLRPAQLRYAASDVAYLLELYEIITERLEQRGRLAWALDECELALDRSRTLPAPEEMWWKLRQARQLRPRERAIAQEVAAWRERKARAADQPVRFFISDLAIASIAHRPPHTRAELEQVRSVEPRHLGGGAADEILAAIERGQKLTPAEIRVPPGPQGDAVAKPAIAIVAAWVAEQARQLEIDPAILATRADLVAFLQDPPVGRLETSWRKALVGEPIRRLVAGEVAVAFERGSLVLEERSHERVPTELGGG